MSRRSETTTKVFVGSLPTGATTEDLRRLFEPYGTIAECDIANRCGFLHLEDKDLAEKAIEELNNSTFMGVRISVEKGRVKTANRSRGRGGAMGPMRGGKDRGGPYSRDGFPPRPRSFGMRDYPPYGDRYDYDRARYDMYGDRRPLPDAYDDRRAAAYMGDRARGYSNGYDRRPPYDDRPPYAEVPRGYDDRRMPSTAAYDDRRAPMPDRRPLMDDQLGQPPRGTPATYERSGASGDMYSRRDNPAKPLDRGSAGYDSPSAMAYASTTPSYGQSSGATVGYGGYGDSRGTAAVGYDTRSPAQAGGYGDSRTSSLTAYSDTRAPPPASGALYGDTRSAGSATAAGSYGSSTGATAAVGGYATAAGTGYDGYTSSRTPGYDSAYPPLPQQRGYVSGGGPAPGKRMPSGTVRRY